MGGGSTSDLADRGVAVAEFSRIVTVPDDANATWTQSTGRALQLDPSHSVTIADLDFEVAADATVIWGRDFSSLTMDDVNVTGGGTAFDLNNGQIDVSVNQVGMSTVVTETFAFRNVSGTFDASGGIQISGSSPVPMFTISESPGISVTIGSSMTVENECGPGVEWQDVGFVSVSDGSISTDCGSPITISRATVDANWGEINAAGLITNTTRFEDLEGKIDVESWTQSFNGDPTSFSWRIEGGAADYTIQDVQIASSGGGLYADFDGSLTIINSTIEANEPQAPAVDLRNPDIDLNIAEIATSGTITSTVSFSNTRGTAVIESMDVTSNTIAPAIQLDNTDGLYVFNDVQATNTSGGAIYVNNPTGSVQINNSTINSGDTGIYLPAIIQDSGGKRAESSAPEIAFIVENSRVVAESGYAIEIESNDPRELTIAIENDSLSGAEGEIAISAMEGSNVTLASFPGGDSDAVILFLQEANVGEPRVTVEGEIGQGENVTAVEPIGNELPASIGLDQNYPNPFNPTTTITFDIPESGYVQLTVFNVFGQQVAVLQSGSLAAGSYSVTWTGRDDSGTPVASGTYLYRLETSNQVVTRKMTLVQ